MATELIERLNGALAARYRIQREIGQGGMAKVYLAHDLKYEREVAVKVLRPDLAADIGATRFLQEIQIAARLHHPHILPLYDSDQLDGLVYYVMPYVKGETLRQRLVRERQLPVNEALQIAREVADALGYAHSSNVVHRDIKPANIVVTADDRVKILDFGVAKVSDWNLTRKGAVLGTLSYMSPEQASGELVDHRTDLWALGAVLYEMLAGKAPFGGETSKGLVMAILNRDPVNLTVLRPGLAPELVAVVDRLLQKEPARRYRNAREVSAELGRLAGQPGGSRSS
jgi:serine/threonine-protein kinase